MSEKILAIRNRLRNLTLDMPLLVKEVIEENETLIEDMVIFQLQRGERGDGLILPNYSIVSVRVYGKPPGPIKLFDTGAFYRGIKVKPFENRFELIGQDEKTEELEARFGTEIIMLQEDNRQHLIWEILAPGLQEKTKTYLLSR